MKKDAAPITVTEYLSGLPDKDREAFETLRHLIVNSIPKVEEKISYGIPTYHFKEPLFHFNVARDHLSFVTTRREVIEAIGDELKGFRISGTTVHFTAEKQIPKEIVMKIIEERLKMVDGN